jgi:hypothetical protein
MHIGPMTVIFAALLPAAAAFASDVRIPALPESVIGAWGPNADACKGSAPGKVDIAAKTHSTADASCEITWITVTASRDGPVYSARSICTQTRTGRKEEPSYLVVTPRPDNTLLVRMPDASPEGRLVTYRKCT